MYKTSMMVKEGGRRRTSEGLRSVRRDQVQALETEETHSKEVSLHSPKQLK